MLCLSIHFLNGYTQAYHPIVKESSEWNVLSAGLGSFLKVCCAKTTTYKFIGDTSIQSIHYKKVMASSDSLKMNWKLVGFIRENTREKKIWLRDLENKEGLIYDFDLWMKKEVSLFNPFYYDTISYIVTAIDSILIGSSYRKLYTLSIYGNEAEEWIEGIGSTEGILNSNTWDMTGGRRELLCFSDEEIEYHNPNFQTCYKTYFTPEITNKWIDTAYLNREYIYQISTTEIFEHDSVSFFNWNLLPQGLELNHLDGTISGIPNETGTFHQIICLMNKGFITDCLSKDLVVIDATQISNSKHENFKIYPNPSNDLLVFSFPKKNSNYKLMINNLSGKRLIQTKLDYSKNELDISNLEPGTYILSVYNSESWVPILTQKFIKI